MMKDAGLFHKPLLGKRHCFLAYSGVILDACGGRSRVLHAKDGYVNRQAGSAPIAAEAFPNVALFPVRNRGALCRGFEADPSRRPGCSDPEFQRGVNEFRANGSGTQ